MQESLEQWVKDESTDLAEEIEKLNEKIGLPNGSLEPWESQKK